MIRVGITGSNGQLGQSFQSIASEFTTVQLECFPRAVWDICDVQAAPDTLSSLDVLINCAAYTQVDQAESEPDDAYLINRDAVAILAKECAAQEVFLIHYSSDYVYHNGISRPLKESDPTQPKSVYAQSKLEGEQMVRRYIQNHLIFRVSWLYGPFGHNFPKTMLRLANERSSFRIVNDQWGSPTNTVDLARMTLSLIDSDEDIKSAILRRGTYNFCNLGHTSWDQIARLVFDQIGREDISIEPIPSQEYPTPAERPNNSRLDLTKYLDTWEWPIPSWEASMRRTLEQLVNK